MRAWPVLLTLAAVATLALAACGGGGDGPARLTPTPIAFVAEGTPYPHPCPFGGIGRRIWLSPNLTVNAVEPWMLPGRAIDIDSGSPITIRFSIANCSTVPAVVSYATSQRYDFVVTDRDGEVWRWSADKLFAQVTAEEELKSVTYMAVWDQRDAEGEPVEPGFYTVTARVTGTLIVDEGVNVFDCEADDARQCVPEANIPIEITP